MRKSGKVRVESWKKIVKIKEKDLLIVRGGSLIYVGGKSKKKCEWYEDEKENKIREKEGENERNWNERF